MIRALRRTWKRLLGTFTGSRHERELAEELEAHILLLTQDYVRQGLPVEEAYRRATLYFGGIEATKELYRAQRGLPALDTLRQDLRDALRAIRRSPGFSVVTILLLAIGIGANTTLFSIVNAVLLRPLPYPDSDRLAWIGTMRPDLSFSAGTPGAVSYMDFADWRQQQTVFESFGAYQPMGGSPGAFLINGEPVRMEIQRMSAGAFDALQVRPIHGRLYGNDEDRPLGTPSVVLSYQTWQERFGGAAVAGKTVTMNSVVHVIQGVMPPGFSFPYKGVEAWLPLGPMPAPGRSVRNLAVIGRLKPGVTIDRARAEMATIVAQLEQAYPETNKAWQARVEPMMQVVVGEAGRPLWILFGAVSVLLIIACSNVANLLLARASVRQHELSVRAALGASRGRIVRQLLVESLLLSVMGTVLALALARAGLAAFIALAGSAIPRAAEIRLDGSVMAFAAALAIVTGVVFGLAPTWTRRRVPLHESLRAASGRTGTAERGRMRHGLIVAEVALTLVLLTAAGLLLRSFQRLLSVNQGFSGERVVSVDVTIPAVKYRSFELMTQFFADLTANLRALPGVEDVGLTSRLPLTSKRGEVMPFVLDGAVTAADKLPDQMEALVVSPGYFSTMGIRLLRGRLFTDQDGPGVDRVVIVDEEFARRHWPGEDPVGRRIRVGNASPGVVMTVVGVVDRVKLGSLNEQGGLVQSYMSARQRPGIHASIVVKSRLTPAALAAAIRDEVRRLDPAQPIHNLRTIAEVRDSSLASERLNLSVLGVFALVALALSVVGLYGVLAYSVARRHREIGVRTALGARPQDVLMLVLGQGLRLTALGIVLGIVAAFWLTRWLSSLLYDVTPLDPATFSGVSMLLLVVALSACWIPARRAARIDPIQALREQ